MSQKTVAVVGGMLQGVEAVYLAKKAGIKSILIDKCEGVPAQGLCDEFLRLDVCAGGAELLAALRRADMILPATENRQALDALQALAKEHGLKLAYDAAAYAITSSKKRTDALLREHGVPAPRYYPECAGPYIIKPSEESGSSGVRRAQTAREVEAFLAAAERPQEWIAQEYLEGKSYSIEVIGLPGSYRTYTITEIHMDEVYDCKRVTAPCVLLPGAHAAFERLAVRLAELVNLHGIMDVEVIDHHGVLKVLELDARLPSQTPITVLHSSRVNLLAELYDIVVEGGFTRPKISYGRDCSLEHFEISRGEYRAGGEHLMTAAGPLSCRRQFCGADIALTDYHEGAERWRGTFINFAETKDGLATKRERMADRLRKCAGAETAAV